MERGDLGSRTRSASGIERSRGPNDRQTRPRVKLRRGGAGTPSTTNQYARYGRRASNSVNRMTRVLD